jgi:hypothetical protein
VDGRGIAEAARGALTRLPAEKDSDEVRAAVEAALDAAAADRSTPTARRVALEGRDLVARLGDDLVREFVLTGSVSEPDGGATAAWFARYPGG